MQVTNNMSQSNLVPIVDPMYETYASSVAPKGSLNWHQSIDHIDRYTIIDRLKKLLFEVKFGYSYYLRGLFIGNEEEKNVFGFSFGMTKAERVRMFLRAIYYSFKYTPATTKYVRENKQRLSCNEKQVNQIAEGSLEWDDAACVLKYDQLEKVEQTVLQKILNASKPTK